MDNLSLSDIASVTNRDGCGDNWILILLFAMIFGWGGNGFGNRGDFGNFATSASQSEILLGQQFQGLDNKIDRLGNGIADSTFSLNNSISSEGRSIQQMLAECCCNQQKNVDSVNFNLATQSAAIQANDSANTQKILDAISTNRMADMQNQINQLQLQSAMAGVVKYPMISAYTNGNNPFCGCNNNGF